MSDPDSAGLSNVERDVLTYINFLREHREDDPNAALLSAPAKFMHEVIAASHGNVKLRLPRVAAELGIAMRSLQRMFTKEYGMTMREWQFKVRLRYIQSQLRAGTFKLEGLADDIGYNDRRELSRFFIKCTNQTPSAWIKAHGKVKHLVPEMD